MDPGVGLRACWWAPFAPRAASGRRVVVKAQDAGCRMPAAKGTISLRQFSGRNNLGAARAPIARAAVLGEERERRRSSSDQRALFASGWRVFGPSRPAAPATRNISPCWPSLPQRALCLLTGRRPSIAWMNVDAESTALCGCVSDGYRSTAGHASSRSAQPSSHPQSHSPPLRAA